MTGAPSVVLDEVRRLVVAPGETVVLTLADHPTAATLMHIERHFAEHFPGVRLIVLPPGAAIDVLAPVEASA